MVSDVEGVDDLKGLPLADTITDDSNYWMCNKTPILDWLERELANISMRKLMININVKTGQRISITVLTSLENPHKYQIRGNTLLIILKYLGWDIPYAIETLQLRSANVVSAFRRGKLQLDTTEVQEELTPQENQVSLHFLNKPHLSLVISSFCIPNFQSTAKYALYQCSTNLLFIHCDSRFSTDGYYLLKDDDGVFSVRFVYVFDSKTCFVVLDGSLVPWARDNLQVVGRVVSCLQLDLHRPQLNKGCGIPHPLQGEDG